MQNNLQKQEICFSYSWNALYSSVSTNKCCRTVCVFVHEGLANLTPGQWVSSDWLHCCPYPIQTGHLQLPQDVVLCWPLVHVSHQHLPKLPCAVEVRPVTNTFVLNCRKNRVKDGERRGRPVGIRQLKEAAHLKQLFNQLSCHTIPAVSLPTPTPYTLTHIIPITHIQPSLLESLNAIKYFLPTKRSRNKMVDLQLESCRFLKAKTTTG